MTAVLFDMFGVIARQQSPASRARLAQTAQVPAEAFWDAYWSLRHPYDRGDQLGPEYWAKVAARLGTRFDEQRTGELIAADVHSWSELDQEMVEFVSALSRGGVRTGLLSNIPEELAAHYEQQHTWLEHFSVLAFSCRIGHAKPEPGAYLWCAEHFQLPPGGILFVDDREDNVRAAEALGMRVHLFTSRDKLRQALTRAGIR
ncbi:HAD family hydrolase [Streptomyces orinoci]|uniref:HAD family phosphatase n=1 Tax=Streptomyces orinoci TaxID=67339 RepID=A0ABV3JRR9_STRON|nr:HAD family phosphatase [Streptomyces orinoci]